VTAHGDRGAARRVQRGRGRGHPAAEAFRRDIPAATIQFFDTGHFALETHADEIATSIREFFA
jgi:hypothetical protein